MSKDFNETVLHRIRSRWSCACGGQTMSLMRQRAVEKSVRRAARLSWVPRFHLGRATAQTTIERCQLCGLLLLSTRDFFLACGKSRASSVIRQAAVSCSPELSVQHAVKLGKCTWDTETCARVRGVCQLLRAAVTDNLTIVSERRPDIWHIGLIRHVLGTVERRLC